MITRDAEGTFGARWSFDDELGGSPVICQFIQDRDIDHYPQWLDVVYRIPEIVLDFSVNSPANSDISGLPPSILYFPHSRQLSEVVGQAVQREAVKYEWTYSYQHINQFPGSFDSYLVWLDYAEHESFERVVEFLNGLDFDGKRFKINRQQLDAEVITKSGDIHPLHQLSSGEQNLMIMLLELRRRLTPHSIVLIDEIENSLHPAFQYRLANSLLKMQKEMPFQLIVTTHAPAFVEIFGAENTVLLTEF